MRRSAKPAVVCASLRGLVPLFAGVRARWAIWYPMKKNRTAEIGGLVPREGEMLAKSGGSVPFRGRIRGLVPALGRISRFGTRKGATRFSRPGVSPDPGNQIAEVGRNRGTKPRVLPESEPTWPLRVPNFKFCHGQGSQPLDSWPEGKYANVLLSRLRARCCERECGSRCNRRPRARAATICN